MAKKFFPKALSVGLSLALCAGMVAPAFAASFTDLQNVINGNGKYEGNEITRADDTITLNGNVTREENESGITINKGDITIDLNGYDINGNEKTGAVITVTGAGTSLTIQDSTAKTVTDEKGEEKYESGAVTGGNGGQGAGVIVKGGASATLESGSISNNTAKTNGGGVYVENGSFTMNGGEISNNYGGNVGGGVYVNTQAALMQNGQATFEMNGGTISGNTAVSGGGVGAYTKDTLSNAGENGHVAIDINGGKITGNTATTGDGGGVAAQWNTVNISNKAEISGNNAGNIGGGVWLSNSNTEITDSKITGNHVTGTTVNGGGGIYAGGGTANISGTEISGNTSTTNGGGIGGDAKMTLTDVTITGNHAKGYGGGMYINGEGYVTVDDTVNGTSKIYNNTADGHSDDVYKQRGATIKLPAASLMNVVGKDGKPITGWYWDDASGWGNADGKYPYTNQNNVATSGEYTNGLCLKAAHDQYFNVEYTDGADGTLFETQQYEVENKNPVPVFSGGIPERPGYTFAGWLVDGENFDPATGIVTGTLTLVAAWTQNPAAVDPETPDLPDDTGETELDDQAVPLAAGPVTRAEFIDYLWRHEGEPASDGVCTFTDVAEDHEYVLALAWAEQNGIAEAYLNAEGHEDGTFEPDELVSAGDVREFLGNFARVFGTNAVAVDELTTLAGDDGEAVLNCDEVLAQFFGEEYTSAKDQDDQLDPAA